MHIPEHCLWSSCRCPPLTSGPTGGDGDRQPEDFHYTHLWVDKEGETHLKECSMKGFDLKQYAKGG